MPPSPTQSDSDENPDFNVDNNNNTSPTSNHNDFNAQQDIPSTISPSTESHYTRNRSTTRSWPVIYRNNSLSNQQNYLEPNVTSKTEQLQSKTEQKQRKSTHQYDFDQIFGLNNANYQQYLASHRKQSSVCDIGYDKSPSIYDMQHLNQESPQQTTSGVFCSAPPTVIFLLLTLLMTTTATAMLCAAIMTDHWENVMWDKEALMKIVNQSAPSKNTDKLEFLLDGKVARLPFKGESISLKKKNQIYDVKCLMNTIASHFSLQMAFHNNLIFKRISFFLRHLERKSFSLLSFHHRRMWKRRRANEGRKKAKKA